MHRRQAALCLWLVALAHTAGRYDLAAEYYADAEVFIGYDAWARQLPAQERHRSPGGA